MDSPILIAASLIACSLACLLVSTAAVDPNYLDDMTETGELEQLDPGSIIPISTPDPKPDSGTPAAQNASATSWTIPEIAGTAVGGTTAFATAAAAARYIYRCVETGRLGVQIFQRILDLAQVFAARLQHGRPGEVIALPPI